MIGHCPPDEVGSGIGVRQVSGHYDGGPGAGRDFVCDSTQLVGASGYQNDVRAGARRPERDFTTNTATRTGYDHDLVTQRDSHGYGGAGDFGEE